MTTDEHAEAFAVERDVQLALEVHVSNLQRSLDWYQALGFRLAARKETFSVLQWDDAVFFLKEHAEHSTGATYANIRVLVPDVDRRWEHAVQLGVQVVVPIADRGYGIRDFTLADPDGFGVRFGTSLHDLQPA
jgi:catechol 2,3-dioxygenase-like lactoylglutathione lyase family enzyme